MTNKLVLAATVAAVTLGFGAAVFAAKEPPIDLGTIPDHKVAICHFPGHDGDAKITGKGFGCVDAGGKILIVSKKGAERGHGVDLD